MSRVKMAEVGDLVLATKHVSGDYWERYCVGYVTEARQLRRLGSEEWDYYVTPYPNVPGLRFARVLRITPVESRLLVYRLGGLRGSIPGSIWRIQREIRADLRAEGANIQMALRAWRRRVKEENTP
jgi:hypothetical protein